MNYKTFPVYQSHKKVFALKISKIEENVITPADTRFQPFEVSDEYLSKHDPQPGGYFVVYKDGYQSFSPAAAFEDGYSLVDEGLWGTTEL